MHETGSNGPVHSTHFAVAPSAAAPAAAVFRLTGKLWTPAPSRACDTGGTMDSELDFLDNVLAL